MKKSADLDDASAPPAGTRKKDDSSLFSIEALTQARPEPRPAPPPKGKEESGIIDIRALAQLAQGQAAETAPRPSAAMPHADVFAAGTAGPFLKPAPTAVAAEPAAPVKAKGSKMLVIVGIVVAAAVAGVAVFASMRGAKDTAPPIASAASPAPKPAPEPTAPPTATAPEVAAIIPGQISQKETLAKSAAVAPGKAPAGKGTGTAAVAAAKATATAAAAAPPPEEPPPAPVCDLRCQMEKAVNKSP
ncbi:MAG: hypothetical protein U0359_22925 [Byssovorax sp.]